MINSLGQLIFFLLTPLSHISASLFFAKPRFGKCATAAIWLIYVAFMLILPPDTPMVNFFLTLCVHFILFFVTTTGRVEEKGFLFFSYAGIYTCCATLFSFTDAKLQSEVLKCIFAIGLMALMQAILYIVLLPAFRKVAPYIHNGWGKFYAVVLGFFALIIVQAVFPSMPSLTEKEIVVFLLTLLAFCITYVSVFSSMKNMVELSQEKQKQTHAQFLLAQVQSQAKEAEIVRKNRHDLRHHAQMLLSYAEQGELDALIDYLKRQNQHIESITTGRYCENETVNTILNVYQQKANEQNITMEIRAAAKPNLSADAPDLVAIVANVLENALHGALQSNAKEPFIRVNIKHQAERFVISCDNSCAKTLQFEEMPEYLRGIGIQSITDTADKYNGTCRFTAKDGTFHCMVIMDE